MIGGEAAADTGTDSIPFVMVDNPADPPWREEALSCPECGEPDLPLLAATSDTGRITLHYIKHCGSSWLRGPMEVRSD